MSCQIPSNRRAFTLIEMLVVIAILAIMMAILTTAVQKVREASNQAVCRNNLKQMGMAFQAHHDVFEAFPSGGTYWSDTLRRWKGATGGVPAAFDSQSWGWGYQILPYIDQKALWALSSDNDVGDNPIKVYSCPTARPQVRFRYTQAGADTNRYMWDYSGNGGAWGTWSSLTTSSNSLDGPIVPSKSGSNRITSNNTITDGLSNVMLIGEKYLNSTSLALTPSCNDDQGWVDGWDNDAIAFVRGGSSGNAPSVPRRFDGNAGCGLFFGSGHTVMQSVFCDGSVHGIQFTIDPAVFLNLCVVNDGNGNKMTGVE